MNRIVIAYRLAVVVIGSMTMGAALILLIRH